jgi:hypothetical protein
MNQENENRKTASALTGGCHCGAIRYELHAQPTDAGYCHCTMCRKSAGAPVLAFARVPLADFVLTNGSPATRRSSSFGERWFCRDCGSQIAMRVDHQPDDIDFTVATLDEPDAVHPIFHIWHASHIPWFETGDNLPRYAESRPQNTDAPDTNSPANNLQ